MTAAEMQQRVDAWLDARSAWLGQDSARWSLASQWQAVSQQFGADSPAALGVLLGLIRELHGCPSLACGHEGGWGDDWNTWTVSNPPGKGRGCAIISHGHASEAQALLAALEAAP